MSPLCFSFVEAHLAAWILCGFVFEVSAMADRKVVLVRGEERGEEIGSNATKTNKLKKLEVKHYKADLLSEQTLIKRELLS